MKRQLLALGLLTATTLPVVAGSATTFAKGAGAGLKTFTVSVERANTDQRIVFDEVSNPIERRPELRAVLFVDGQAVGFDHGRRNANAATFQLTYKKTTRAKRVPIRVALFDRDSKYRLRYINEPIDINFFNGNVLDLEYEPATGQVFQNGRLARKGSRQETIFIQEGSPNVEKKGTIRLKFTQ